MADLTGCWQQPCFKQDVRLAITRDPFPPAVLQFYDVLHYTVHHSKVRYMVHLQLPELPEDTLLEGQEVMFHLHFQ